MGEPAQNLLALAGHVAQGISGVDVVNGEGVAVDFVQVDAHLYQQFDARSDVCARLGGEVGFQHAVHRCPNDGAGFGPHLSGRGVFVHQFEVAVARVVLSRLTHLGTYPVTVGQCALQRAAHKGVEFKKREFFAGCHRARV